MARLTACLYLVFVSVASAQIVTNYTSLDPVGEERFGASVAASAIGSGVNLEWVIVGVPKAAGGMGTASEAGEVEFFPPYFAVPFKISAPSGYGQAGAHFGSAVAAGYIDNDSYADVAIGAPDQDVNGVTDRGMVFVFFGPWTPSLNPPYTSFVILDVPTTDQAGSARFGACLAVGNLDGNQNFEDIIVGAPHANAAPPYAVMFQVGAIDIFLNVNQFTSPRYRDRHVQQDLSYLAEYNHYGSSVAIGYFRNHSDSDYDIAVGVPDTTTASGLTGLAQVHFGHEVAGQAVWDNSNGNFQNVLGYAPEQFSRLGTSVATDIFRYSTTFSNLAIGAPGRLDASENPNGPHGSVHVYQGSTSGLVQYSTGGLFYAPTGPPNYDTAHNLFGYSLVWACTSGNCSTPTDLLVGAPGATTGVIGGFESGRVIRYSNPGTGGGPGGWPSDSFLDPTPNNGERFGWTLASSNRGAGTSFKDIIIGAPRSNMNIPNLPDAGEVYVWNY